MHLKAAFSLFSQSAFQNPHIEGWENNCTNINTNRANTNKSCANTNTNFSRSGRPVSGAELTRKEGRTKDDMKDGKLIGGFGSVARLIRARYHSFVEK